MFESYRTIIKRHFPNAGHIIDTFHFLRYVENAFNDVRIRIQKKFKIDTPEYKILKRHWKILSTYSIDVEGEALYNPIKKINTSARQIIDDACRLNEELNLAYELTQDFLYGIRNVKYEESRLWLENWLDEVRESNIKEFIELNKMFDNWKVEILHSFIRFGERRLHNGYIEGINNKIKVIKRIGYGYRNFTHFRNRIMYMINKDTTIKKVDVTKIFRKPKKK